MLLRGTEGRSAHSRCVDEVMKQVAAVTASGRLLIHASRRSVVEIRPLRVPEKRNPAEAGPESIGIEGAR